MRLAISRPTTDAECTALRRWAESVSMQAQQPASPQQLSRHLMFMQAALPSKNVDEASGAMKVAVYASLLGSYCDEALAFMATEACRRLHWFPTPRQCLDIIAEYRPPVSDHEIALRLCQDYTTDQFGRWYANLKAGQPVGDVPEQWMRIAVERGAMRRLSNGSFVSRALYHGPVKPYLAGAAA